MNGNKKLQNTWETLKLISARYYANIASNLNQNTFIATSIN